MKINCKTEAESGPSPNTFLRFGFEDLVGCRVSSRCDPTAMVSEVGVALSLARGQDDRGEITGENWSESQPGVMAFWISGPRLDFEGDEGACLTSYVSCCC